jgi:lipid A 3-O-deacylase
VKFLNKLNKRLPSVSSDRSDLRTKKTQWAFFALFLFVFNPLGQALDFSKTSWSFLAGGGRSHPGWGSTSIEVKTNDIAVRIERPLSREKGTGFFRHFHSLMIEIPFHVLRNMNQPLMLGTNFFACWVFTCLSDLNPYLFAGGGPVLTQAEIPGTSSVLRGAYGFGCGIRINVSAFQILLEARYHHLSNGGIQKPNEPLNSHKLLLGISLNSLGQKKN